MDRELDGAELRADQAARSWDIEWARLAAEAVRQEGIPTLENACPQASAPPTQPLPEASVTIATSLASQETRPVIASTSASGAARKRAPAAYETKAAEYLKARGSSISHLLEIGGDIVPTGASISAALRGVPCILFPVVDPFTDEPIVRNGKQVKIARRLDGAEPKFMQPADSGTLLFFDPALNWAAICDDPAIPILIGEGPTRAMAGYENGGWAVIAASGVDGFLNKGKLHELVEPLAVPGRRFIFAFDSDQATNPNVARALNRNTAPLIARGCDVDRLDLPCAPNGDKLGLDDYLAAHGTAALTQLLASAQCKRLSGASGLVMSKLSDIEARNPDWLWQGWLVRGAINLIAGVPSVGKSTICLNWAATVSRGGAWPDGTRAEPGSVLLWSGEDAYDWAVKPRFLAASGDTTKVHVIQGARNPDGTVSSFDPGKDMAKLAAAAKQIPDLKIIVVEPLVLMAKTDSHNNADTRRDLQPLADVASELNVAVLGVTHFTKGTAGRMLLDRVTGSLAFGALARVVHVAVASGDPGENASARLVRAKINVGGRPGDGFNYEIKKVSIDEGNSETSKIVWGAAVSGNPETLVAQIEGAGGPDSSMQEAVAFLNEILADGPRTAKEVREAAQARIISTATLRRARGILGVVSEQMKGSGSAAGWVWRLPTEAEKAAEATASANPEQSARIRAKISPRPERK